MPRTPDSDIPDTTANTRPDLGPSDSSDSASDLPPNLAHTDSDSQATGERESVNPGEHNKDGADIAPDRITSAEEAGLALNAPDPVRNGG